MKPFKDIRYGILSLLCVFFFAASIFPQISFSATLPGCPEDMIAYWRADSDASDYLGNQDGTLMNGAGFAEGVCESAFSLDSGSNDYISIAGSSDFDLDVTDDKSFALWWKANDLNGMLISRRVSSSGEKGLSIDLTPDHYRIHLEWYHHADFAASYFTGEWNHLVVTKAGTTWRLYHNVVEVTISESLGWPYNADATQSVPLLIGKDGALRPNFNGLVDEVAVYNEALTAQEALDLYQSSCHYCGLSAITTPTPAPTPTIPQPTPPVQCEISTGSISFNGQSDYISLASAIDETPPFSILAWVYLKEYGQIGRASCRERV